MTHDPSQEGADALPVDPMMAGADAAASAGGRDQLVDAAVRMWIRDLIDLGPRNQLLYYRDLTVGTLDLGGATPAVVAALLFGKRVQLSDLYTGDALDAARKRARAVHSKILEMQEERGISVGYVAIGMATWNDVTRNRSGSRPPAAPVLLRRVTIDPRSAAGDDYTLEVDEEVEVNPVLIHLLETTFAISIEAATLDMWAAGVTDTAVAPGGAGFSPTGVYAQLTQACAEVPGFAISERTVVGTFSYAKLPMVSDLKHGRDLLVGHDIVAALAGDRDAQASIRSTATGAQVDPAAPDHTPPADEFLVMDADSSQSYAVNAVVGGNNLVIKGPPGTGKSQTISNLVASLIARGKKVLFVAEKRAAIDAVLTRLTEAGLAQWVMDLHDGAGNRRRTAQSLAASLDRAAATPRPVLEELHRGLVGARDRLLAHEHAMHDPRQPWGLSLFDIQGRLLGLESTLGGRKGRALKFRLTGQHLNGATPDVVAQLRDDVAEYTELGGISPTSTTSPWHDAPIATAQQTQSAYAAVTHLRDTLGTAWETLTDTVTGANLPEAPSVQSWRDPLTLLIQTRAIHQRFRHEVFAEDLLSLLAATGTRAYRKQTGAAPSWGERRKLRKHAEALCILPPGGSGTLHEWLVEVAQVKDTWRRVSQSAPAVPDGLDAAAAAHGLLTQQAEAVAAYIAPTALPDGVALTRLNRETLAGLVENLIADRATLQLLPRRHELEHNLAAAGLGPMLSECRGPASTGPHNATDPIGITADEARDLVDAVWMYSIVAHIGLADPGYGGFSGATQTRIAGDFRRFDTEHVHTAAARVQRACAERLYAQLDAHADQATLIRGEANKKRRHKSMRDLLAHAPDVLLAAKPCWAMSPLVVSHTLPMQELFDIVIFDEASQIPPADAIASIVRGRRVAVAGDERQLPPTAFFTSATPEAEEAEELHPGSSDELTVTVTSGYESILDSLATIVPFRSLGWHYRSQDERLIAFSNAHIYDSSLTTFPGAHTGEVLTHVPVAPGGSHIDAAAAGTSSAEVARVVDLVVDHARSRPNESLGVITMGIKHAHAIEEAVRLRVRDSRDLLEYFDETRPERFFVKNLERSYSGGRRAPAWLGWAFAPRAWRRLGGARGAGVTRGAFGVSP